MKGISKLMVAIFLLLATMIMAQPPCPTCPPGGGGGVGGTTPEAPSSPIDMYIYILGLVAILLITLYSKRIKQSA